MANLATAIDEARRQAFVGRSAELARFDEILRCEGPARALFVHGPYPAPGPTRTELLATVAAAR